MAELIPYLIPKGIEKLAMIMRITFFICQNNFIIFHFKIHTRKQFRWCRKIKNGTSVVSLPEMRCEWNNIKSPLTVKYDTLLFAVLPDLFFLLNQDPHIYWALLLCIREWNTKIKQRGTGFPCLPGEASWLEKVLESKLFLTWLPDTIFLVVAVLEYTFFSLLPRLWWGNLWEHFFGAISFYKKGVVKFKGLFHFFPWIPLETQPP